VAVRDEVTEGIEPEQKTGLSRRAALKAGVAVGVGAAAWSGASITSLGGTPAYAAGCTFAVRFDLVTCRNTDQGAGGGCNDFRFRYHVLNVPAEFQAEGFAILNNITEGTCCFPGNGANGTSHPLFQFPSGLFCIIRLVIADPNGNCNTGIVGEVILSSGSNSPTDIDLECPSDFGFAVHPSDKYRITAECVTEGSQSCFGP
jgi:hypothetical protein